MATPIQIYYIPGSVTTDPPLEVDAAESVYSFYSNDGWFIASTKRYVPGAQNISLEFSCDKDNFLNAAAVAQRVSPGAELAYREIINSANLNEKFEAICENRDAVVTDYLTAIERPNETESKDLSSLKSHLCQIKVRIETEVSGHSRHWKQALDTRQHALADCLGRIEIISQPCQSNLHGKSFLAQLTDVEDRYKKELAELEEDAACLRERHSQTECLTVPRSLLYLSIALLQSDHPATCRFEEVGVVSWKQAEWENKLEKTNHLADDDYEGLADTLDDFGHFEGVELTAERLKDQHKALMAGLRAMAGDMPSKPTPPPK
ncbi:hypothetical protein CIRG_09893 [Coccidioides immitis RMSCC 2394]|uniref:Uncharacterized protein n=1 Tax=Coccidioides immitis RMSCC 2394 TaxID=404692 RepID=A0A0J7BIM6_COCIT|nr:hypothetical protein CIRG_09893 [Coccidioides immitis RMSCC 2394]